MIRVLHIIDTLSGAGPTRSLISLVKYASENGLPQQHRVVALKEEFYPVSLLFAKKAGLEVLRNPGSDRISKEIEDADIVQLHFWNNPTLAEFLRTDWPSMRLLTWLKIFGEHSPQAVTRKLLDYSDFVLATSPLTLKLPVFDTTNSGYGEKRDFIYGMADWSRLKDVEPRSHDGFNVGYIGTVNYTKMHPRFVPMSAGISIPNVRFLVCGGGIESDLKEEAASLNSSEKFEFRGYVENIRSVLETLDVFGYPLCEDTYATSEKSIQEAMYAGVPPVVFPHGGCSDLVQHEETGLVVNSENEYRKAIEFLYHNPEFRLQLGRNAATYARQVFDSKKAVLKMNDIYRKMLNQPKRKRNWNGTDFQSTEDSPSMIFVENLGSGGDLFKTSLTSSDNDTLMCVESEIAKASPLLVGGEGGINQYRNSYPNDPYLRLWSGLCLQENGNHQKAMNEFEAAIELGLDHWRVFWYKAKSAHQLRNKRVTKDALEKVKNEMPDFLPALELSEEIHHV
jgi:glycosyltransferase involved in cell wall biosynthesis